MKPKKPYHKMNADELAAATKEFECETGPDESRPLSPDLREKWERSRRRPGRPKVGEGSRAVLVTIERGLLARADAFAAAHGLSRSELVSRGMQAVMGTTRPAPGGAGARPPAARQRRTAKANGQPAR